MERKKVAVPTNTNGTKNDVIDLEVIEEPLTPTEYFDLLKGKRKEASMEQLKNLYDNACALMKRYIITGQKSGAEKLYNFCKLCDKEIRAVQLGISTYIDRKDLDEYITQIASKAVVIIELENYERNVPDEIIDKLIPLKENEIFDNYFVVFTDYTSGERKKVEQKKKDKDPILLGSFLIGEQVSNRLYYIGSWEDEFCDLTLDKMIAEFKKSNRDDPTKDVLGDYPTMEDLRNAFNKEK